MVAVMSASPTSENDQPWWLMNHWPTGIKRNCPNEPAAALMPNAQARRSGATIFPRTLYATE